MSEGRHVRVPLFRCGLDMTLLLFCPDLLDGEADLFDRVHITASLSTILAFLASHVPDMQSICNQRGQRAEMKGEQARTKAQEKTAVGYLCYT